MSLSDAFVDQPSRTVLPALTHFFQAASTADPFTLVLLDAQMLGMDGFAVAKRLQKRAAMVTGAIMMLSPLDVRAGLFRCRELGITFHLVKPVMRSALLKALLAAIGAAPSEPAPHPQPAPATRRLRALVAEDNPVNQKLAERLLETGARCQGGQRWPRRPFGIARWHL